MMSSSPHVGQPTVPMFLPSLPKAGQSPCPPATFLPAATRPCSAHASAAPTSIAPIELSRLETGGMTPLLGDHGMAGRCRMHAVGRPVLGRRSADALIEHFLQRDERRVGCPGDPRRGGAPLIELR